MSVGQTLLTIFMLAAGSAKLNDPGGGEVDMGGGEADLEPDQTGRIPSEPCKASKAARSHEDNHTKSSQLSNSSQNSETPSQSSLPSESSKSQESMYQPSEASDASSNSSMISEEAGELESRLKPENKYYLVKRDQLKDMFCQCWKCGGPFSSKILVEDKMSLRMKGECADAKCGEWTLWQNTPHFNQKNDLDVDLVTAGRNNGISATKMMSFFTDLGANCMGYNAYRWLEANFYNPSTKDAFDAMQPEFVEKVKDAAEKESQETGKPLKIAISADAKYDSPGFSAFWCIFTCGDTRTKLMTNFCILPKLVAKSSAMLEPLAAKICLDDLHEKGLKVTHFVTDRCASIRKVVEDFNKAYGTSIKVCYDIWHYIRVVKRDLLKFSKLKQGMCIKPWIKSIVTMLWSCFQRCRGDEQNLKERHGSIPKHIQDIHSFPENKSFKSCEHPELLEQEKGYLEVDSLPCHKINTILNKNKRYDDLKNMTDYYHTGFIESYHSKLNEMAPKSTYFRYQTMCSKVAVTILDWNENCQRKKKLDDDGNVVLHMKSTRFEKTRTARIVREPPTHEWKNLVRSFMRKRVLANDKNPSPFPTHELPIIRQTLEEENFDDVRDRKKRQLELATELEHIYS